MKINKNIAEIQADLSFYIEQRVDQMERLLDIYTRLGPLDPDTKIEPEVADYINGYLKGIVGEESIHVDTPILDTVFKILRAIRDALMWIIKKLAELFRWCLDAHYRVRKEFLDIRVNMMSVQDAQFATKFAEYECESMIKVNDIRDIIQKTKTLVDLIMSVAGVQMAEHADSLLMSFRRNAGVDIVDGSKFTDTLAAFTPMTHCKLGSAGWDLDTYLEVLGTFITVLSNVQSLKETEARLRRDATALQQEAIKAMNQNVSADAVKDIQSAAALKIRLSRIIIGALAVLNQRTANVGSVMRTIAKETLKLANAS